MRAIALFLLTACGGPSAPSSTGAAPPPGAAPAAAAPSADAKIWTLPDGKRLIGDKGGLTADTFPLSTALDGEPSWDKTGKRVVYSEGHDGSHRVMLAEQAASGWTTKQVIDRLTAPALPTLEPEGKLVVFVWEGPLGGSKGVWLAEVDTGSARPLTNSGFGDPADEPPAPTTPPSYDGKTVKWTSPKGEHSLPVEGF